MTCAVPLLLARCMAALHTPSKVSTFVRYLGKKASKRLEPKDWKMEPPAVCREGP